VSLLVSILAGDILPIFAIAAIGYFLARRPDVSIRSLSSVVFNALSPCLVFTLLVTSQMTGSQAGRMALFCVLLTAALAVAGRLTAAALHLDRETLSSFMLVVMFSNSGNYALPLILFAFGKEALSFAAIYFVTGAITVYTVGVVIAAHGAHSLRRAIQGILRVPAVYALLTAVIIRVLWGTPPEFVMRPVGMLADAALPLMLVVLGMQLQRAAIPKQRMPVTVAAFLSLVASPIIGLALSGLLGLTGAARQAAIILSAMPAAVITTVLAVEYQLDPSFATSVVFVTTILSPFTLVLLIAYLQN
jgi:predicted permease